MARRRKGAFSRWLLGAAVVAVGGLVVGVAIRTGYFRAAQPQVVSTPAPAPSPVATQAPVPAPSAAQPSPPSVPAAPPITPHEVPPQKAVAGRVAIIFDDAGGSLEDLEFIITLGRPVTVAVLPGLRFSAEVAERARAAGLEVLLHIPLEADDTTKPLGPGGVTVSMSDEEIAQIVRSDLATVPGAIGVNNHMGSKGTSDERVMRAVLRVVQERHLLFIDSVTTPHTLGGRLAAEMAIRTASRKVFLDNEDEPQAIRRQLHRLLDLARRRGQAVAIGHAHRQTAQVLMEMLDEFDAAGVEFVPISVLAH